MIGKTLFTVAFMASLATNAQTKTHKHSHADKRARTHALYGRIMKQQTARLLPAAKTTATAQRVIAQASYFDAPFTTVSDSAIFKYSGSRGSYFAPEYFTYTPNAGSASFDHFYDLFGFDTYYGTKLRRNEDLFAKSDTTIFMGQDWSSGTPTFGVLGVESHSWDAGNNLTESIFLRDAAGISQRDSITYNTDGGIATVHEFVWGGGSSPVGTWLPQYCSYFRYNAGGNMVVDSQGNYMGSWVPGDKYTYSYDAAGNMVRAEELQWGGTDYDVRTVYEMAYDAGNRLIRYRLYDANTNELTLDDSLGYTTGATYPTYTRVKEYTGGELDWVEVMTKNVTTHGKPDTLQMTSYDTDSTTVMARGLAALVYNPLDNPTQMTVYFDEGAGVPVTEAGRFFYYYEFYGSSNVRELPQAGVAKIQLFPNPTTSDVTIAVNGAAGTTISIADMSGRVVKTVPVREQQNNVNIEVAELPAGMYMVTTSQNGQIMGRAKLVKN
jgi:hypothetical protein